MTQPLWIVHRDERLRAALRRLAGAGDDAVLGAPDDAAFREAPSPRVVLLGLSGDFEAELEFAHRLGERLPGARWLVLVEPQERAEAERLFDALPAEWISFPPTAAELRRHVRDASGGRRQDALSKRRLRDALSERFARYCADLELPDILRALDPRLASVPLLVLGEPGTGRGLLARYVHSFGGVGGAWMEIDCRGIADPRALHAALAAGPANDQREATAVTVCLRDVDALPAAAQYALRAYVELGPPGALARVRRLRWVATAGDTVLGQPAPGLAPELVEALAGLAQRLPPLRERSPENILRFAADTLQAWARLRGERPRTLADDAKAAVLEYPWPGNQRELEAVLLRTLAGEPGEPLRAELLRFELRADPSLGEQGEGNEPAWRGAAQAPPQTQPPARVPVRSDPAEGPPTPRPAAPSSAPAPEGTPRVQQPVAKPPESEPSRAEPARPAAAPAADTGELRRLAQSLAHELRNRLVAIRTFASLLPQRAADRQFSDEFAPVVGADVQRIDALLERLASFGELGAAARVPVDVAALLESRLQAVRGDIAARRLLVLKELDLTQPPAQGDPAALAFVFEALIARALAWVPERGDLYLASKYLPSGLRGGPTVRVVLRFHRPGERRRAGDGSVPSDRELALDVVLAELAVRAQGGSLRIDATDAEETVIAVDLPAA